MFVWVRLTITESCDPIVQLQRWLQRQQVAVVRRSVVRFGVHIGVFADAAAVATAGSA
jgi:hypothetical protein